MTYKIQIRVDGKWYDCGTARYDSDTADERLAQFADAAPKNELRKVLV